MINIVASIGFPSLELWAPSGINILRYSGAKIPEQLLRLADALFINSKTDLNFDFSNYPKIRFIATGTSGTDHLPIKMLEANDIQWLNTPGCNAHAVTDYVLATLCDWARLKRLRLTELALGIIGVGEVGSRLARRARNLGIGVFLNDPIRNLEGSLPQHVNIEELFKKVDVISIHVPATYNQPFSTQDLVTGTMIKCLDSGLFINSSRGSVVSHSVLVSSHDVDLVLDVFPDEPLIPNVLAEKAWQITPHIAGSSIESKIKSGQVFLNKYLEYLDFPVEDRERVNSVNLEVKKTEKHNSIEDLIDLCRLRDTSVRLNEALKRCTSDQGRSEVFFKSRKDYGLRHESE